MLSCFFPINQLELQSLHEIPTAHIGMAKDDMISLRQSLETQAARSLASGINKDVDSGTSGNVALETSGNADTGDLREC
jgi:hypothetical protein